METSWLGGRVPLLPAPVALTIGQDRLSEKSLFDNLKIPVPRYMPVATREALDVAVRVVGLPAVLKTRRLGYDGKGQRYIRKPADVDAAWSALGTVPLILECGWSWTATVASRSSASAWSWTAGRARSSSGWSRPS